MSDGLLSIEELATYLQKVDRLTEGQSDIRERLARLEERGPLSRVRGGKPRG